MPPQFTPMGVSTANSERCCQTFASCVSRTNRHTVDAHRGQHVPRYEMSWQFVGQQTNQSTDLLTRSKMIRSETCRMLAISASIANLTIARPRVVSYVNSTFDHLLLLLLTALQPFDRDYPGEPVPEETLTQSPILIII